MTPDAIIKAIWESDPDPVPDRWTKQGRQFAVINLKGEDGDVHRTEGHDLGRRQAGQVLHGAGQHPRRARGRRRMIKAFEETKGHLSLRFMAALEAGQAAGGDTRGMQAASMVIVKKGAGVWLNNDTVLRFQVDDQENPYKELRRVVESWNASRAKGGARAVTPPVKPGQ